jgi:DNA repair protein RadC
METQKLFSLKKNETEFQRVKITGAEDAYNCIRQYYGDDIEIFESFFILLLNNSSETIGFAKISQGGIVGTVVDNRIICKYSIESLAVGVIIAHNHPSGKLLPSDADDKTTIKIKNALQTFDINLLDHIILTSESFYSYANSSNIL